MFNVIGSKKIAYVYSLLCITICVLSYSIYLSTLGEMWKRVLLSVLLMLPSGHRFVTSKDFNQCDMVNIIAVNVILSVYYFFPSKFLSYKFYNVYFIVLILAAIDAITTNSFFILSKAKSEFTKLSAATGIPVFYYTVILIAISFKTYVDMNWTNCIYLLALLVISVILPTLIINVITMTTGKRYALS